MKFFDQIYKSISGKIKLILTKTITLHLNINSENFFDLTINALQKLTKSEEHFKMRPSSS